MYEQIEKSKEKKSIAVANSVTQKKNDGTQGFGLVDNRLETVAQRKNKEMANKNHLSDSDFQESDLAPIQRLAYNTTSAAVNAVTGAVNPKKSTVTGEDIIPGEMIVSITSKSFSAMPGLNHHKIQVEEWAGTAQEPEAACQHVVADLRATGGAKPGSGVTDSLTMVSTYNTPPTQGLRDGESVVAHKSVATNAGKISTLQAYQGTVGKNGYAMVRPDADKGQKNCQTWAREQYDRF